MTHSSEAFAWSKRASVNEETKGSRTKTGAPGEVPCEIAARTTFCRFTSRISPRLAHEVLLQASGRLRPPLGSRQRFSQPRQHKLGLALATGRLRLLRTTSDPSISHRHRRVFRCASRHSMQPDASTFPLGVLL